MGITQDFSVFLGLKSNQGASINGAVNCTSLMIGNTTINVSSNATVLFIGNSTVSISINSTTFSGTANNATNLNGVAAASYVTTSGNFTLAGNNILAGTNTVVSSNLFVTGTTFSVGNSTVNTGINSTSLFIGNSTVSMTINTTTITTATNTNFTSNVILNGARLIVGNSTVGNVGIRNTAPTVALHIGGNYQTEATNLGTINSTSNNTISFSGANYFRGTIGGACTLTFSNIPTGSHAFGWIFSLANVGTNITWPAAVKWAGGSTPTFSSNTDILVFMTHDAGTTIFASLAIKDAR